MRAWLLTCGLAAALLAGCGPAGSGQAPADGSTVRATWVDRDGNGVLERGPGELLRDRTELAPARETGAELARLAVIADAHVRDQESPGRATVLDRLGGRFSAAFRPQEALTAHVLDGAVRAINRERPRATLVLGDLIDSAQANELEQAIAVLDGGRVEPDSGAPGDDGVQRADNPDPLFYRPDVDAPRHPGLLAAAGRPFRAAGLDRAWFAALGNHDALVQGAFPRTERSSAVATGDRRLTAAGPRLRRRLRDEGLAAGTVDRLLAEGLPGRTERVAADPGRQQLAAAEVVNRVRAAGATGGGGGGGGPTLDHAFDLGADVRAIVLDTTRRDRSGATLEPTQAAWLRRELDRVGSRRVLVASHHPLDRARGAGAAEVRDLLAADRRVLAELHGDAHVNRIRPARGHWVIGTSSLADWPQQARMLRVVRTADGGAALETWMVDHLGALPRVSRELSYLDAQGGRPQGFAGGPEDRNARLFHPGR